MYIYMKRKEWPTHQSTVQRKHQRGIPLFSRRVVLLYRALSICSTNGKRFSLSRSLFLSPLLLAEGRERNNSARTQQYIYIRRALVHNNYEAARVQRESCALSHARAKGPLLLRRNQRDVKVYEPYHPPPPPPLRLIVFIYTRTSHALRQGNLRVCKFRRVTEAF